MIVRGVVFVSGWSSPETDKSSDRYRDLGPNDDNEFFVDDTLPFP